MSKEKFALWYGQLQQLSLHNRWRNLVVLAGDNDWLEQYIDSMLVQRHDLSITADANETQGLIYQPVAVEHQYQNITSVNRKNYVQQLGTEQHFVIFPLGGHQNGYSFDVDAFAALSGTLVAGGTLVLTIINDTEDSIFTCSDNFIQRFYRMLKTSNSYIIRQTDEQFPTLSESLMQQTSSVIEKHQQVLTLPYACVTQEQVLAVDAMLKVVSGHRDKTFCVNGRSRAR